MPRTIASLVFLALVAVASLDLGAPRRAFAQTWPRTTAERTDFDSTSTSVQVGLFLDSLQIAEAQAAAASGNGAAGASGTAGATGSAGAAAATPGSPAVPIAVSVFGHSAYGRPLYLAIASDPPVTSPAEAAASGRLVVYLQGNIHAGEVEGKEAILILLRELATTRRDLLQKLVILAAPDYNPDGNDAFGPEAVNRSDQDGPPWVGRRSDALNLDLNRDYLKAEAPETRASLARIYDTWDPALMVDCHTTDGTRHGYLLTYAPPLSPNGPSGPTDYVRDRMLPALERTMDAAHEPIFVYGDVDDPTAPTSWDTYAPLGWYGTNYVGLRGRMAILSEAYAHADFATRIRVTHDFLVAILEYAAAHAEEIRGIERDADRETTLEGEGALPRPQLAVEYSMDARGTEPVSLEILRVGGPGDTTARGRPVLTPTGRYRTVQLPIRDRFADSVERPVPAGYFVPAGAEGVAQLLAVHGVQVERLAADWTDTVEVVAIQQLTWQPAEFQGHHLLAVSGSYARVVHTAPAGSYFVSTAQPLGRLVFALLEPEGWGLARWGMFDRLLGAEFGAYSGLVYASTGVRQFPVWRALRTPGVPMRVYHGEQ